MNAKFHRKTFFLIVICVLWAGLSAMPLSAQSEVQPVPTTPTFPGTDLNLYPFENDRELPRDDRHNLFLSEEQNALLAELAVTSAVPLSIDVWTRGGTVGALDLAVPSGLDSGVDLHLHAQTFLERFAPLWALDDLTRLTIDRIVDAGSCSMVVYQLVGDGGVPIFNAGLAVTLTRDGIIRAVEGHVNGDPVDVAQPEALLSAEAAAGILSEYLDEPELVLPEPVEIVLDPFYLSDAPHTPSRAWLFEAKTDAMRTDDTVTSPAGPYIVSEATGSVVLSGPALDPFETGPCGGQGDPFPKFPDVVVDPLTNTPAFVSFSHFGGMPTIGGTALDRVFSVLESEVFARMYGDFSPRNHLSLVNVTKDSTGRIIVNFAQHVQGVPIDGAYLSATLTKTGKLESLSSRYVYRPETDATPFVTADDVTGAAAEAYTGLACPKQPGLNIGECIDQFGAAMAVPLAVDLVILSSKVLEGTALPPETDRLAWRFRFPEWMIYWDAMAAGDLLYAYPLTLSHIPHNISDVAAGSLQIINGAPAPGVTPTTSALDAAAWVAAVEAYYQGLGQDSYDNQHGSVDIFVNDSIENAYWDSSTRQIVIGEVFHANDVFAHEFTHAVTNFMVEQGGLIYYGEPGALNESFSDIFGNLIFPDQAAGQWLVAEEAPVTTIRDMVTPELFGNPGHVGLMDTSCLPGDGCVHVWSGVPNRAAVLISDGGIPANPHPGIGRRKLERIYLSTLVDRMQDSDRFLNQRIHTLAACRALVGIVVGSSPIVPADCDHIANAFDAVGINATTVYAWMRFSTGLFGGGYDVTVYDGLRLYNGCTIADLTIVGRDASGGTVSSNIADGLVINMTGWGAYVKSRASATDPAARSVSYRIWSEWFESGVVDIHETYNRPAGVASDADCLTPEPTVTGVPRHLRELYSTTRVAHWASFFIGGRDNELVNLNILMPQGCEVQSILGVHYHKGHVNGPAVNPLHHGNHGFTLTRPMTLDPRDLTTYVHSWYNGDSGIFVRVLYTVIEPDGVDCSVAGFTQDQP